MKKLLFILPSLCFLASWAAAETIESVSFNPARLGRYESLKISDTLTTPGGIEANAMTVQSGGTVNFSNNQHYQADAVSVKGKVNMPNTLFRVPTLNSKGTASFNSKASTAQSSISTLNSSLARIKADVLKLGSLTVTGATTANYAGSSVSGMTLGNNKIPVPASSCKNLQWVTRKSDDGYTYKVLGFGSCVSSVTPSCRESYGSWASATSSTTDQCDGDIANAYTCPGNVAKTCVDVQAIISDSSAAPYADPFSMFSTMDSDAGLLAYQNLNGAVTQFPGETTLRQWDATLGQWVMTNMTYAPTGAILVIGGGISGGGGGGTSSQPTLVYQKRTVVCCAN